MDMPFDGSWDFEDKADSALKCRDTACSRGLSAAPHQEHHQFRPLYGYARGLPIPPASAASIAIPSALS